MKDASLRFLAVRFGGAAILFLILNLFLYWVLFADTAIPLSFPYHETFDQLDRLRYRQFGGVWQVRDAALVQSDASGTDLMAVIPLALSPDQPYRFSTRLRFVDGRQGGGLMFNLQHPDNRRQSHMVRLGTDDEGIRYLVYGSFDDRLNFVAQGSINNIDLPASADGNLQLDVQVDNDHYAILLNGNSVIDAVSLIYEGGYPALTTWFSAVAFDDVTITTEALSQAPAPTILPTSIVVDDAPLLSDTFDDSSAASAWTMVSGTWTFEAGELHQTGLEGFDLAISHADIFSQYVLVTHLRHEQGVGGGVLFNMPQSDSTYGGQMVRYFENNVLAWGYFDESGAFVGQGSTAVTPPGQALHQLQVRVSEGRYAVTLDGVLLAENIPLISSQGHIGLTASQSSVAFEDVQVLPLDYDVSGLSVRPESTAATTGDWQLVDGVLTQVATESAIYLRPTGLWAERFQLTVDIALGETATYAEVAFHLAEASSLAGGYAVRLDRQERMASWGRYDEAGSFQVLGTAALTMNEESQNLSLNVAESSFDLRLNQVVVAESVPLDRNMGWISLVTNGGPVSFTRFTLAPTEIQRAS